MTYRQFDSTLEGHPTTRFRFAEAATGSYGQGLSIGLGMALNAKYLDRFPYRTYVLLGDSEMAEGSQWEALQLAAHYQLSNLVGILDVNRLGQRGETMYGHDLTAYQRRVDAFGWRSIIVEDGHDHGQVLHAYQSAAEMDDRPVMIIAKTVKGGGVSFLADERGWHGNTLDDEKLGQAVEATGHVVTVEDHYAEGGLGDAVRTALADSPASVHSLAVRKRPRSGSSRELLEEQGISARAVVEEVRKIVSSTLSAPSATRS